jgi:DUF971 family protein
MAEPWPQELILRDHGRLLRVSFDNGMLYDLPAELLRVESPSAEVKGHGPGQEQLVNGKRHVTITQLEPVGTYAIRLVFSDGHSTGLFTWAYLDELGKKQHDLWAAYLAKLAEAGATRG